MPRIRILTALTVVVALAFASVALAAKVTGGTTTVTASNAAAQALSANHIAITPLAPATASGNAFTFPIARGRLNAKTLRGFIVHRGGIAVSNGTRTVRLRRPTIVVANHKRASLFAVVRGRRRDVVARIARIKDITVSNGSATGTVTITQFTARLLNALAHKPAFKAGDVLGTATTSPTLK
jgi:hypothetical protein